MDFAVPLLEVESAASKAGLHLTTEAVHTNVAFAPNAETRKDDVERCFTPETVTAQNQMLVEVAEQALEGIDTSDMKYKLSASTHVIEENSLVVIFESFDKLSFVYVKKDEIYNNKNGVFHHNDFIGKSYGCTVRSRSHQGFGYVRLLKPTAELWARSLNHRTQIIYELDSAMIVHQLQLRPGYTVLESGTGSGALSTNILRTISPNGTLHTYEFNGARCQKAREEFALNMKHLNVTVHHRDVCGKGPAGLKTALGDQFDSDDNDRDAELEEKEGGFGLGGQVADAVFLDLPEPWLAVPHAAYAIKPNKRIASYSPCIEQVSKCVEALKECHFHSIRTVEVRLREYYVDEVMLEPPPSDRLLRPDLSKPSVLVNDDGEAVTSKTQERREKGRRYKEFEEGIIQENPGIKRNNKEDDEQINKKQKRVYARDFATMRGHTAFLTFATSSLIPQPDPHKEEEK